MEMHLRIASYISSTSFLLVGIKSSRLYSDASAFLICLIVVTVVGTLGLSRLKLDNGEEDWFDDWETTKVNQDHFETDVPIPFRASAEIDNQIGEKPRISMLMLKTYAFLGFGCMICDEHATQSEYDRIQAYLKMIYDFLEEELDNGGDITEPGYIIQELLDNLSASAGYDKSQFGSWLEPKYRGV